MLRSILAVARKELRQARRDPRFIAPALIAPFMLLSIYVILIPTFGGGEAWACGLVVDDQTSYAAEMAEIITNMKSTTNHTWFTITEYDSITAKELFQSGSLIAYVLIPSGFGANISAGLNASVVIYINNINDDVVKNYVHRIEAAVLLYNQGARYPDFSQSDALVSLDETLTLKVTPGLSQYAASATIILSLIICAVAGQALATAAESESRAIYETLNSPISRLDLILGRTIAAIPRSLMSIIIVFPITAIGMSVYPTGNFLLLGLIVLFTILALAPIGEIIGMIARKRETALLISVLLTVFAFLAGGGLAPIGLMPQQFRIFSLLLPTTHTLALWTRIYFYNTFSGLVSGFIVLAITWTLGTAAAVFLANREVQKK